MRRINVTPQQPSGVYAKAAIAELRNAGGAVLVAKSPRALRQLKRVQEEIKRRHPDGVVLRVRDDEMGLWRLLVFRSGDAESYQAARDAAA